MKKIIYFLSTIMILISSIAISQENDFNRNIERHYCSDEEVEALILNSRERAIERVVSNRDSVNNFKERRVFESVYGDNSVQEEGACAFMALPSFRKLYRDSVDGFKSILNTMRSIRDGDRGMWGLPSIDIGAAMSRAAEESCRAVDGLIDTASRAARDEAEFRAFQELSGTVLGGLYHDYYLELAVDNLLEDRFTGSEYLEWRGGYDGSVQPRENAAKRDSENRVRDAVRGLFDD